jgi:hypothetical protein
MVVRLNETAGQESSDLPLMSPSHHPGIPPDDSRQEANTSRFTDCSEAQMRSVVDDVISTYSTCGIHHHRIGQVSPLVQRTVSQIQKIAVADDCAYVNQTEFFHPAGFRCAQNHSLLQHYSSTRAQPSLPSPWLQATSKRRSSTASPSPLPHSVVLNSK